MTGHSAFAYRQSHSSPIRGVGRQSVNFGKLTRQTVGHQLLGNMEVCCMLTSVNKREPAFFPLVIAVPHKCEMWMGMCCGCESLSAKRRMPLK